jgi:hypothetical protein
MMGSIPLLVLGVLAAIQLVLAVATVQATSTAARAASRAVSQGRGSPVIAAQRAVPGWVAGRMTVNVGGPASGVRVTTQIPVLFPGISGPSVSRAAWFDPENGVSPWG